MFETVLCLGETTGNKTDQILLLTELKNLLSTYSEENGH